MGRHEERQDLVSRHEAWLSRAQGQRFEQLRGEVERPPSHRAQAGGEENRPCPCGGGVRADDPLGDPAQVVSVAASLEAAVVALQETLYPRQRELNLLEEDEVVRAHSRPAPACGGALALARAVVHGGPEHLHEGAERGHDPGDPREFAGQRAQPLDHPSCAEGASWTSRRC